VTIANGVCSNLLTQTFDTVRYTDSPSLIMPMVARKKASEFSQAAKRKLRKQRNILLFGANVT